MMTETNRVHEGRNVKRIREILGIKQETLASDLGMNQQKISLLEGKEKLDEELLEEVAKALKVSPDTIRNFNEEAAINIISSTFNSHDNSVSIGYQSTFNFNPIDKIIQLYEENKALYERMLREKDEMLEKYQSKA